ncbi:MAG TPA: hypothetical protein VEC18_07210 [Myxococcota bacterium]|nr:hypothetical protein [Myxococcota bacterium]
MRSRLAFGLAMASALAATAASLALAAPAARAEVIDEALRTDFPKPGHNPALIRWRESRNWRYSTDFLFGATRGLSEQGMPRWCEGAAWIATVPFDIANLPFAALAGLFGD